jgi:lipopolysaccharide/colanic/teichoic acid biosynthesis glycosyltransferase
MTVLKSEEKGLFNAGDSSRITKTGRIIRRAKLDELPQLINVIKGDMSLVGPRPEVEKWINAFPERWAMVHQVKPG